MGSVPGFSFQIYRRMGIELTRRVGGWCMMQGERGSRLDIEIQFQILKKVIGNGLVRDQFQIQFHSVSDSFLETWFLFFLGWRWGTGYGLSHRVFISDSQKDGD